MRSGGPGAGREVQLTSMAASCVRNPAEAYEGLGALHK